MTIKYLIQSSKAIGVVGILIGSFMVVPGCFAGGAVTIIRDKHVLAPRGSYIPQRRVRQVLEKVKKLKAAEKEKESLQHQKQVKEPASPKP
ncbi:MAG: hypothetical protein P8X96_01300 [Desulfobacteraceae bacterium]